MGLTLGNLGRGCNQASLQGDHEWKLKEVGVRKTEPIYHQLRRDCLVEPGATVAEMSVEGSFNAS